METSMGTLWPGTVPPVIHHTHGSTPWARSCHGNLTTWYHARVANVIRAEAAQSLLGSRVSDAGMRSASQWLWSHHCPPATGSLS